MLETVTVGRSSFTIASQHEPARAPAVIYTLAMPLALRRWNGRMTPLGEDLYYRLTNLGHALMMFGGGVSFDDWQSNLIMVAVPDFNDDGTPTDHEKALKFIHQEIEQSLAAKDTRWRRFLEALRKLF